MTVLETIRDLLGKATPGPWMAELDMFDHYAIEAAISDPNARTSAINASSSPATHAVCVTEISHAIETT